MTVKPPGLAPQNSAGTAGQRGGSGRAGALLRCLQDGEKAPAFRVEADAERGPAVHELRVRLRE